MDDHERLHAINAYCTQYPNAKASQIRSRFFFTGWDAYHPTTEPPPVVVTPPATDPSVPPPPLPNWKRVIDSRFQVEGVIPDPWISSEGGGFRFATSGNWCRPENAYVSGGLLRLLMKWDDNGPHGAGWYTGYVAIKRALRIPPYASTDQCVTLRWRIQANGTRGHQNIPMRWPASFATRPNTMGEEDCWEGSSLSGASTFLHFTKPDGSAGRVSKTYTGIDMTQFHTYRFVRYRHTFETYVDGVKLWSYGGDATSLPDYPKIPLLQQESKSFGELGQPNTGPGQPKSAGTEEIQIDFITVDNPI